MESSLGDLANESPAEGEAAAVEFQEFLATVTPGRPVRIAPSSVLRLKSNGPFELGGYTYSLLKVPDTSFYCVDPKCDRVQVFASETESVRVEEVFLLYRCKNCGTSTKSFALRLTNENEIDDGKHVLAVK
jgi:hypothetical protein